MAFFHGQHAAGDFIRLAGAEPIPELPLNEKIVRIPLEPQASGKPLLWLEATLFRPDGAGPFPLLVLSHGTPREAQQRLERQRFEAQSWIFVQMGFAVIIPMRRGYGHSEGSYAEEEGECERARYYEAGMASAHDLLATVRFMQTQPYIEAHHIILAGHSSGGFASLALASLGFPGLQGVINFSGGRGAKADQICNPAALIDAFARFGRTCRVPTLWIYSENDTYFRAPLVQQLYQAFVSAGGSAQLVKVPPFLAEGHFFFSDVRGLDLWPETVRSFINRLGIHGRQISRH
ncbi:MAG: alpha/beta hydrolase family protein [Desulfobaccales bacterium]